MKKAEEWSLFFESSTFRLFFVSLLALFTEFLFIRWLPLRFVLLGYYSNLILISALLGLGVGMIFAEQKERSWISAVPQILAFMVIFVVVVSFVSPVILPLSSTD